MTKFLLPVPTHTVGTNLINVQYDREMIPILTGLLQTHGKLWAFDPNTGDELEGEYYVDTLVTQLLEEIVMNNYVHTYLDCEKFIPLSGGRLYRHEGGSTPSTWQTIAWQNATPFNGQKWYYDMWLPANTYAIEFNMVTSSNAAIMDVYVNSEAHLSFDMYSAAATPHQRFGGTIATLPEGNHRFWIEINGKNALATDYYILIESILLKSLHT